MRNVWPEWGAWSVSERSWPRLGVVSAGWNVRCSRVLPFGRKRRQGGKDKGLGGGRHVETKSVVQGAVASLLAANPGMVWGTLGCTTVYVVFIKVLLAGMTWAGVIHSWMLGSAIFSAFGLGGYALVSFYFLLGSMVTKIKLKQKEDEGIAEARSGRRSVGSVWGSGLAAMFCSVMALLTSNFELWQVGFVASIGSKLSDTVSSEIGKAYGKTTYLITTMETCPRGTEGAISVEGTLAGIGAALLYGLLAYVIGQVTVKGIGVVFVACVVANLFESYLGAAIQGQVGWLTNDVVNMVQICLAAALAIGAYLFL